MTSTSKIQRDAITDAPIQGKKYILYPAAIGHRLWLEKRGNKTTKSGILDLASAVEICFAYTTEPEALQSFTGDKARKAINSFQMALEEAEFVRIMDHVKNEFEKNRRTQTIPKKKQVVLQPKAKKRTRHRK